MLNKKPSNLILDRRKAYTAGRIIRGYVDVSGSSVQVDCGSIKPGIYSILFRDQNGVVTMSGVVVL